jgi:hypothetical protein
VGGRMHVEKKKNGRPLGRHCWKQKEIIIRKTTIIIIMLAIKKKRKWRTRKEKEGNKSSKATIDIPRLK